MRDKVKVQLDHLGAAAQHILAFEQGLKDSGIEHSHDDAEEQARIKAFLVRLSQQLAVKITTINSYFDTIKGLLPRGPRRNAESALGAALGYVMNDEHGVLQAFEKYGDRSFGRAQAYGTGRIQKSLEMVEAFYGALASALEGDEKEYLLKLLPDSWD